MSYETTWHKYFRPNHCTKGRVLHRIQSLMRKLRTFFQLSFRCQLWCEFLVKFFDIYYTTIMTWEMWYFVIWWCNKTGIVQEISFCLWYLNATGVKITQPLTPLPKIVPVTVAVTGRCVVARCLCTLGARTWHWPMLSVGSSPCQETHPCNYVPVLLIR